MMRKYALLIFILPNILFITFAQKRVQDTWFHSFLADDYKKFDIQKVAIFTSMDTIIEGLSWLGVSPTINLNINYPFKTSGDYELQQSTMKQLKRELEKLGYEVVLLNPLINERKILMQELLKIANLEMTDAIVLLHYNVYKYWKIQPDDCTKNFWMENISETEKTYDYFYSGFLIMPNLYIYDVKSGELIYRLINYGNNGDNRGGFFLSEQSAPIWKKEAAENSVKSIVNIDQSGFTAKYNQIPYYPIPKAGMKELTVSTSKINEHLFWERSRSIVPYFGYFPLEYGITVNRVYDCGNHNFGQWSIALAHTTFSQSSSVFSIYALYEFANGKEKWLFKRLSTRTGVVFGFGVGGKQEYTEHMIMDGTTFTNHLSSTTGRLILGMTFQIDYLLTRNFSISLRAMPSMDVHFYYPDEMTIYFEEGPTDKESGIAQKLGIPIHFGICWYFK